MTRDSCLACQACIESCESSRTFLLCIIRSALSSHLTSLFLLVRGADMAVTVLQWSR